MAGGVGARLACGLAAAVGLALGAALAVQTRRARRLAADLRRQTELRAAERAGRTAAERRLRGGASGGGACGGAAAAPADGASDASALLAGWRVVGRIASPFVDRRGTPRQGLLAPSARASLPLDPAVAPAAAVEGLRSFSHVWLLFVFHENTNGAKLGGGGAAGGAADGAAARAPRGVRAKVHPPRLGGASVGSLATRSPHRPSPLGLSVVALEGVAVAGGRATLELSGVDLLDGTPVLDVKPYVSHDRVPAARWPAWCAPEAAPPLGRAALSAAARAGLLDAAAAEPDGAEAGAARGAPPHAELAALCAVRARALAHARTLGEWWRGAAEAIALDPRALHQGRLRAGAARAEHAVFELRYDALAVAFEVRAGVEPGARPWAEVTRVWRWRGAAAADAARSARVVTD